MEDLFKLIAKDIMNGFTVIVDGRYVNDILERLKEVKIEGLNQNKQYKIYKINELIMIEADIGKRW